jgi:signal transduction histidine kinase
MKKEAIFKWIILIQLLYFGKLFSTNDSLKITLLFSSIHPKLDVKQVNGIITNARKIAKNNEKLRDIFSYHLAKHYFASGNLDSSQAICNYILKDTLTNPIDIKFAKYFNILASVYAFKSENSFAIKNFQHAIKILEHHKKFALVGQINNNIANIFLSLFDYKQAYNYSKRSYELLATVKDTTYLPSVSAVYGVSLLKVDSVKEAFKLLKYSLNASKKYKSALGIMLANYGMGEYFSSNTQTDSSSYFYNQSLQIANQTGIKFYQLINHLGLANFYISSNQPKQVISHANAAKVLIKQLNNNNAAYSIYKNLGTAYFKLGRLDSAYLCLDSSHQILKQISSSENKKIINELLIKYESSKKENELNLVKIEALTTQKRLSKTRIYVLLLLLVLLVSLFLFFLIRQREKRKAALLKVQQEEMLIRLLIEAEENERERISNELHDSILSELTAIRLKYSSNDEQNKNLNHLHQKIRKIAHNLFPISFSKVQLHHAIEKVCIENNTDKLTINFHTNLNQEQKSINAVLSKTLYLIFCELIQNVKKHANAKMCFVNLIYNSASLILSIEDDGIGLSIVEENWGQGLNSIKKRIGIMQGTFNIIGEPNGGTICTIIITL